MNRGTSASRNDHGPNDFTPFEDARWPHQVSHLIAGFHLKLDEKEQGKRSLQPQESTHLIYNFEGV
jgi:hypothetical protein